MREQLVELINQFLVPLGTKELEALNALAESRNTSPADLIRGWVLEHIETPSELTT